MELKDIKGLGEARIKKLEAAGITSPRDLLCRFPYKYISTEKANDFEVGDGEDIVIYGRLTSAELKRARGGISYVRAVFAAGGREVVAVWFNQPFMARALKKGEYYTVWGKFKKSSFEIKAPKIIKADGKKVVPLYRVSGIPVSVYENALKTVLSSVAVGGFLPCEMYSEFGLMPTDEAYRAIHFPESEQRALEAKRSVTVENMAYYMAAYASVKNKSAKKKQRYRLPDAEDKFAALLPFTLTSEQKKAIEKVKRLMDGDAPMNALLEGDVGSGKTVVALFAAYYAAMSGYQAAIMAPTEILASQHYRFVRGNINLPCAYLSGSQSAEERRAALSEIESGRAKIIIGSHAVIQKSVNFFNLAFVAADEQQRFGVNQRGALENKGDSPDSMVISATPIPRTLALSLYGELEKIVLGEKPRSAKVLTRFVGEKQEEMLSYIARKAQEGEQAYIVCARIESDGDIVGAEDMYSELVKTYKNGVGLLHGRMSEDKKSAVMQAFMSGEIKVLVSTTIVEVGVDCPSATTMAVFNAERFGLSQLHQLRGRVGRGEKDGYCFLVTADREAYVNRLKYLETCDDGFRLAEYDFEARGAGDFLGTRQHGKSVVFTGVPLTLPLLELSRKVADALLESGVEADADYEYFKELTLN